MASGDWSQLPTDLILSVSHNLTVYADYIRLRAVCPTWRSSLPVIPRHLPHQFPWLMLCQSPHSNSLRSTAGLGMTRRGFYNPLGRKLYFLNLPEASNPRRICGSSCGWLVVLDESPEMFCLNPVTRAKVHLPPLSSFPNVIGFNIYNVGREYSIGSPSGTVCTHNLKQMRDTFLKKVVLSHSPADGNNYVALGVVSCTGQLAFCRKGDTSWKFIPGTKCFYEDVIYWNGLFYGVDSLVNVAMIDVGGDDQYPSVRIINTPSLLVGDMQYLVGSEAGDLFLVARCLEVSPDNDEACLGIYETRRFEVYKLDQHGSNWNKMESMDGKVIFVGKNSSLLLESADFPGCKGNCVYFTDDHSEYNYDVAPPFYDMGIYVLKDDSIEKLPYFVQSSNSMGFSTPPPVWISPSPC